MAYRRWPPGHSCKPAAPRVRPLPYRRPPWRSRACRRRRWRRRRRTGTPCIVQDGTVPAVTLVCREGYQAGNAVFPLDVFIGHDLVDAGHLFRFREVDGGDFLHVKPWAGPARIAGSRAEASVPRSSPESQGPSARRGLESGIFALDPSVSRLPVRELPLGYLAAEHPRRIHHRIDQGLVPAQRQALRWL